MAKEKTPKPKYNMWQNSAYMIKLAWKEKEKKVLALSLTTALISVANSIVNLYVTPTVLKAVEDRVPFGQLIATILIFTGLLILLAASASYVGSNVDWTFFRENTEGSYAVGDNGLTLNDEIAIDFTFTTKLGTIRIIRAAFEYARKNKKKRVTAVTKANIIKNTDGMFLKHFYEIAKEYPEIVADDWYIDIMTAKLIDEKRRKDFQVFVLPNLYGDILTDEAAEFQGGVGTAGSANVGNRYAMFEAIHGSAPRMVLEGREKYADPRSIIRAAQMLLEHIGYVNEANLLNAALNYCASSDNKLVITGRDDGVTTSEFTDHVIEIIEKLRLAT